MDWVGFFFIVGSIVTSGLYGYTVIDNLRTAGWMKADPSYRSGRERKIRLAAKGMGLAVGELFWVAAIIWINAAEIGTEDFRGMVFIVAWLVSRVALLWLWWRIQ